MNAVEIKDLRFSWPNNPELSVSELTIGQGESIFLHGPSGSGKTTLLGLLSGILTPTHGSIDILGTRINSLSSHKKDMFRGDNIGYIFQMFNLIPYLSVIDNIALSCAFSRTRKSRLGNDSPETAAQHLAGCLEIDHLLDQAVNTLSVGQAQRVAAARALLGSPPIIIADEPTSALDLDQRKRFVELLFSQAKLCGSTLVFVSHDHSLKNLFPRSIDLRNLLSNGESK